MRCIIADSYNNDLQNMSWKNDHVSISPSQITANFYVSKRPKLVETSTDYGIGEVTNTFMSIKNQPTLRFLCRRSLERTLCADSVAA